MITHVSAETISGQVMKVLSDPAHSSALNTWLRGPEETEAPAAATPPDEVLSAAPAQSQAHATDNKSLDSAEGLLDLDAWNGASAASQPLSTAALAPQPATSGNANPAQVWAEHIFQPLL
jgi:hypothetical protein